MNAYKFTVWYESDNGVDTYYEVVIAETKESAKNKLKEERSKLSRLGMGRFEIGEATEIHSNVIV